MKRVSSILLCVAVGVTGCDGGEQTNDAATDVPQNDVVVMDSGVDAMQPSPDVCYRPSDAFGVQADVNSVDAITDVPADAPAIPAAGHDWRCVGTATPPVSTPGNIDVNLHVASLSARAISNAVVKACAANDATCAHPFDVCNTFTDGTVVLTIPGTATGFDGYFEVTGSSFPSRTYIRPNITSDRRVELMTVLTDSEANLFAAAASVTLDPMRGHVAVTALDCSGIPAPNVVITASTADAMSTTTYPMGGLPSSNMFTDDTGQVGIFNLPPGPVVLRAVRMDTGATVTTLDLDVRAGFISLSFVTPAM